MSQVSQKTNLTDQKITEDGKINIYGAREHNLKNLDISIPRNKLTVITGLSGSGKSSLAFDTVYSEGQRRYLESFSAYARQFIGNLKRPDVDKIDGLSPVISIEQKSVNKNPRSTVGTITEIYDFLRLLFARASDAYSYVSDKKMIKMSDDEIFKMLLKSYTDENITILAPKVKARKGHYRELFEQMIKTGYNKVRIDGNICNLEKEMKVSRYQTHDIELVIDRISVNEKNSHRLKSSLFQALKQGDGSVFILKENEEVQHFSRNLICPDSGISYNEPQPNSFSFNSPYGYCPKCRGAGISLQFNKDILFNGNENKSLYNIFCSMFTDSFADEMKNIITVISEKHEFNSSTIYKDVPEIALKEILYGSNDQVLLSGYWTTIKQDNPGVLNYIAGNQTRYLWIKNRFPDLIEEKVCFECKGYRLKKESYWFKIDNKHIGEVANMQLNYFYDWLQELPLKFSERQNSIAAEILKEINTRTGFLLNIGLNYLSLNRPVSSLSGGEAQRIRLATQIGSQLINVTYILDEPSIGLHQRDNNLLINSLCRLRDNGNTVVVVEHDKDMICAADHIIDLGPGAGIHGGHLVAEGTLEEIIQSDSITAQYLTGKATTGHTAKIRKGNNETLQIKGASGNNLKNIDISFPLGKMICVTGVSGSGKSTLVSGTLLRILKKDIYRSSEIPLAYESVIGLHNIDKVIEIDQSPIGRTPRSNPATYTNVFNDIRKLFTMLPEALIRGYKPGRFSFNVKGGRCEECRGGGVKTIEMNFLPDVHVECPLCNGKRYNKQTLEVRYKGKSINDVLEMTIEEALEFFEKIPSIKRRIQTLSDVGLSYLRLGQPSHTISGGEAQRVKLATELSKRDTGKTFYILDEPTTGLHFEDIRILMKVLNNLADKGNTVLIIEHNMDVIKHADHIIDLGLEGGDKGGYIVCEGTPEEVAQHTESHTGRYLEA